MKIRDILRRRQKRPFPSVQCLREPGSVEMHWHAQPRPRQPKRVGAGVSRQLIWRRIVLVEQTVNVVAEQEESFVAGRVEPLRPDVVGSLVGEGDFALLVALRVGGAELDGGVAEAGEEGVATDEGMERGVVEHVAED